MPSQPIASEEETNEDWWDALFPLPPYNTHQPGAITMRALIAYDIACHKRLSKVAKTLLDYGLRVQFSIFECEISPERFDKLWEQLLSLIDEEEDRLVAYILDAAAQKRTRTAGTMTCLQEIIVYII